MPTGNSSMVPVQGAGWTRGLDNILHGELKRWFSARRGWVQILLWTAVVNLGFITALTTSQAQSGLDTTLLLFNILMGLVGPVGIIITMQSSVGGEKRSGTAAWVLSKPVSRIGFILAKLLSNGTGFTVTRILPQGLVAYLISNLLLGYHLPILGFLAGLGVHLANILFYLALTLMLGTAFENARAVIAIPLAFFFFQNISMSFLPALAGIFPWTLTIPANSDTYPSIAMNLMTGVPVPSFQPLIITLAATALFVSLAVWIFRKQDL
jgi:ABC-2 type transport system permease protein